MSGRFQIRYFHLGRRITGDTTFPTKTDARAFLAGVETDIRRGNFFDPSAGRVTFAEYSGWWLDQRSIRPRTRPNSVSKIYRLFRTILTTGVDDDLLSKNPARIRAPRRGAAGRER